MNNFSPEEYLASRLKEELEAMGQLSSSSAPETKHDRVAQASQAKVQALEARLQKRMESAQKSLVGRMGLDSSGVVGNVVNDVAGMVSEGAALASNLGAISLNLAGAGGDALVSEEARAAFQRELFGTADEADRQLLDQPVFRNAIPGLDHSNRDQLKRMMDVRQAAEKLQQAGDISEIVAYDESTGERESSVARRLVGDTAAAFAQGSAAALEGAVGLGSLVSGGRAGQLAEEAGFRPREGTAVLESWLSPEQQQVNQRVEDADGFTETLGEGLENPSVIPHNIIKSVPSMIFGGVLGRGLKAAGVSKGIATTAGEGLTMAGQSAENFRQQNEDGRITLKQALLSAGVGAAGTLIGRAGNSLANRIGTGDVDEAIVQGALQQVRHSAPVAAGLSGAIEGGEELLQSGTEQLAENLGLERPWDNNLGDAMAMGLITGAPMGVMGSGQPAPKEPPEISEEELQGLIQPGETFDPATAMGAIQRKVEDPRTEPEQLNASLGHLNTLRSTLESQLKQATPEALEQAQAKYSQRMGKLDQIQAQLEAQPDDEGKLQQLNAVAEKRLQFQAEWDAAQALPNQREQLQADLEKVTELQSLAQQKATPAPTTLKADLELADRAVTELDEAGVAESQAASDRLVTLAMHSPEYLPAETAQQLADNSGNGLNEMQRTVLRRFAEAKALAHQVKGLSGVRSDIFQGNEREGYKGLDQYQANISQALNRSQPDLRRVRAELDQLKKFAESRLTKQQVITQAYARVKNGGEEQWLPSKQGWVKADRRYSRQEMYEMGGLTVHKGSQPLVEAVKLETKAVRASLASLRTQAEMIRQKVVAQRQAQQTAPVSVAAAKVEAPSDVAPKKNAAVRTSTEIENAVDELHNQIRQRFAPLEAEFMRLDSLGRELTPEETEQYIKAEETLDTLDLVQDIAQGNSIHPQRMSQLSQLLTADELSAVKAMRVELRSAQRAEKNAQPAQMAGAPEAEPQATQQAPTSSPAAATPSPVVKEMPEVSKAGRVAVAERYNLLTTPDQVLRFAREARQEQQRLSAIPEEQRTDLQDKALTQLSSMFAQDGYATFDWQSLFDGMQPSATQRAELTQVTQKTYLDGKSTDQAEATPVTDQMPSDDAQPLANADEGMEVASQEEEAPAKVESDSLTTQLKAALAEIQEDEASVEEVPDPEVDGTLSLYAEPSLVRTEGQDINEWFQQANLVREWYEQRSGARDSDDILVPIKGRPLALEADFLSAWEADPQLAFNYLPEHFQQADDDARGALIQFQRLAREWQPAILASLKPDFNDAFRFTDPFYYLTNREEDGGLSVDENLVTAMALSGASWLAERVAQGPFSTPQEINGLLGRDSKHPIKPVERNLLADKGLLEDLVHNAMGQSLLDALGFKASKAPDDFKAKLTASVGTHIAAVLLNKGLLQRKFVSFAELRTAGIEMGEMITDPKTGQLKVQQGGLTFLRPAVDFKTKVLERNGRRKEVTSPEFQEAVDNTAGIFRNSGNILGALFGVESAMREPDQAVPERKAGTTNNTRQNEPTKLAKILAEDVKRPWQVRWDMAKLLDQLSPAIVERMVGIEVDLERVPKMLRKSVQAKNDALRRDLDNARYYLTKLRNSKLGEDTLLYMPRSVWKLHRVGMVGNVLNAQASKIHRPLVAMQAWKVEIDPKNNLDSVLGQFKLAVMEGLGTKTDKQSNAKSIEQFDTWYQQKETQKLLDALVRVQWEGEPLTAAEQYLLLKMTQQGGEKLFSADALLNASEYHRALTQGGTFSTSFFREVDGKTNGSMLAHLQLMPFSNLDEAFAFLRRGGFYRKGDAYRHYSEFRSDGSQPGNVDIYEAVVRSVYQVISQVMAAKPKLTPQFGALWNFIGHPLKDPKDENSDVSSDGRNLVKTPTTGVVYGSGMGGTLNGMKAEFQEKIFVRLYKLANGQAKSWDSAELWLNDLNTLLAANKAPIVKLPADIDQLLELELTPQQLKALDQAYGRLMYQPVKQAMEHHFGKFMKRRNLVNRATRVMFHLYNAAYGALKQAEIDRLMAAGDLPFYVDKGGNKVPRHGLLAEQEQAIQERLKDLFPAVHSPFSVGSNDQSQAVPMTKSERSLSDDPAFKGQAQFSKGYVTTADGKRSSSLTFAGFQRLLTNPGVAGMVLMNQSGDSAISADGYAKLPALNNHDAHVLGLADAEQGAKNLNQATFEVMASYSMLEQVEASLYWALNSFNALLKDPETAPLLTAERLLPLALEFDGDTDDAIENGTEPADGRVLRTLVWSLNTVRKAAEQMKLDFFRETASVDQYSMEGGAFSPSAELLAQLESQQKELAAEPLLSLDVSAIDALLQQAFDKPDAVRAPEDSDQESDRFEEIAGPVEQPARPTTAAWGELGQSTVSHDAELVTFFEQNQKPSLRDTVKALRGRIETMPAGRTQNYYRELWKQLMQSLGNGVSIEYVTEATALPEGLDPAKANTARGLYAFNARSGKLYIKSPAFRHSGITTEMLLHELTHAAVARLLDQAEQGQASAEVLELKNDLQRLLDRAREFTAQEGTAEQWAIQLESLQEFVAWGMTNQAFQREVLNRFSVSSKTGKNRLVVAAKAFIERLRDLLFAGSNKSRQQIQVQALTQLLRNVGGLMQAVQEQREVAPVEGPLKVLAYEDGDGYLDIDDLFDALGNDQPALAQAEISRLKDVLGSVVKPLHGPFGAFRLQVLKSQQGDAAQQFLAAQLAGEAPLASRLQAAAGLSDQLAFVAEQVEVTVRTALDTQDRSASLLARELKGLYNEVVQRVGTDLSYFHAGNWNQATAQEKEQAQALKEAFLGIPQGEGPSDYLSRFAALGLSHPLLHQLLQAPTSKQALDLRGLTLWEKLSEVVARLTRLVAGKLTNTWAGQAGDAKLGALVRKLVLIETRHRERLARPRNQWIEQLEDTLDQVSERGRQAATRALDSGLIKGSRFTTVRVLGKVTSLAGQERADQIISSTLKLRERMFSGHYGFIAGMANEVKEVGAQFMALLRLAKHNEQHRKHLDSWTRQQVLESFANKGKNLSDLDRQALGYLLRTDVADLFNQGLSLEELRTLLIKDNDLKQRMGQLSQQLMALPQGAMYVHRAKALGVFMTTQTVTIRNLGLNAKVIAEGHATAASGQIPVSESSQAEPLIDALASYQALLSLKPAHKQRLADVIQAEMRRTDGGNGIETTLRLHRMLKQQAYDSLFQGRELHWMKGYLPEVTNPQIELAWADDQEGAELEAQGWESMSVDYLQQDSLDRSNLRRLYRLKGRGPLRWQSGALSLTGMKAKGFTLREETVGSGQLASILGQQGIADMDRRARLLEDRAVQQGKGASNEVLAVPLLDDQGNVVDYRYLMTAEVRDSLLQRNNDFAQLLGNLNAQTFDKRTAAEQNLTVVQAMYDHWQEAVQRGEKAFINIGQDSPDAEGRELWHLLPEASRKDIRAIWGGDFMQVPAGQYDLVAGYRKLSAVNAFDKLNDWMPAHQRAKLSPQARKEYERDMRNLKQQLLVWLVRDVFRLQGKAALRVRQFEDVWQAIVQEVKDIVVIRTGLTLFWNVVSNLTLLWWQGVPIKDMARHHWTAWRGAVNYRKDSEELFKLENELQMGMAQDPAEHRRKIRQLEDALSRNPARELIEAGMLPTIVEDVALDGDEYSYRNVAQEKLKEWTGWVPEQVRSTAATLYMAPGTVLHKGLSQATQYSDFISRYTLYQHLTQRSKAPLSHSEALERISDSFINYDVPSERQMQYLNDMGVFMFTKYYLRIQRVILQQFREKPVRGLLLVLLDNYLQGMQMIVDSGFWSRLGNPLEWGALQFPGSLDELATIGGLTALWK